MTDSIFDYYNSDNSEPIVPNLTECNDPIFCENVNSNDSEPIVLKSNTTLKNTTKILYKTDGSPNKVRAVTFLILYVPQLILSLILVIDVTNKASWRILRDQPSLILMAVFTHFTCARVNTCCGSTDIRVKISKVHTIMNIIVSMISYIVVFITAHLLLDGDDWGWDLEGAHTSILSQLMIVSVPFIVLGIFSTLGWHDEENFYYYTFHICF